MSQEYTVCWLINEIADSPEEAAQKAFDRCFKPNTDATVFSVKPMHASNSEYEIIDLNSEYANVTE